MNVAPRRAPATLEDFAKLRDTGHVVELIEGEIAYKALPSPAHGGAQVNAGALLDGFNQP